MKTIARYLIYIAFMTAAVIVLLAPVNEWMETGALELKELVIHCAVGFSLVFAGTEVSEQLKVRWRDRPEDREKDREGRERSRR